MKSLATWFFSKTQGKEVKQEITNDMLNDDVEHVIDCIVQAVVEVSLIRKPSTMIKHKITGKNLVISGDSNYAALTPSLLLFEIAQGINSNLHKENQIGATDEGQMILVLLDDDMSDILQVVYSCINEIYKTIKKSDTHIVAKGTFEKGLNNHMREKLRLYFKENIRVPAALTHFKACNILESVNIGANEISNILSRSLKKGHSDVFSELYNDKPSDVLLVAPNDERLKVEPSEVEKLDIK